MIKLNKNNAFGCLEILITGIIWGFIGFFVKELDILGASASLIAFFRVFFAFVFALIVSLFLYKKQAFILTKEQLLWCFLDGVLTQGLFNFAYSICVEKSGVMVGAILLYTSPVFNAIITYIAFSEKLGYKKLLILILNMIGCAIAATGMDFTFKTCSLFGILMGLVAGLLYGASPVLGKYANKKPELFIVITYNELFASIVMFFITKPYNQIQILSTKMLVYGIMYGVIITGLAYMFYYDGIKRMTDLNKIPVIASIETVVATLVGVIIYKENLNIIHYIGIVLVLLSIVFMSTTKKSISISEAKNDKRRY